MIIMNELKNQNKISFLERVLMDKFDFLMPQNAR